MTSKKDRTKKIIVLTGGGTAGHIIPNLALLPDLINDGWEVHYIGSKNGMEADLLKDKPVQYHEVSTGKLRRYFDLKNFSDPFKVVGGITQASLLLSKIKPSVIFSKGGFVSVPVVIAAKMQNIPSILHESDITPGLANKICLQFSNKICTSFKQTLTYLPRSKSLYTGSPLRPELLTGNAEKGYELCGFDATLPVILVTGGSLGSANLNRFIRNVLPELLKTYQVIHICGKDNLDDKLTGLKGYRQFEYISDEQPHIFKISTIVISRAGANSIFEFLNLALPSILIPISRTASRGDQILNATEFEKAGYCIKLEEESITSNQILLDTISTLYSEREKYIQNMTRDKIPDAKTLILKTINDTVFL